MSDNQHLLRGVSTELRAHYDLLSDSNPHSASSKNIQQSHQESRKEQKAAEDGADESGAANQDVMFRCFDAKEPRDTKKRRFSNFVPSTSTVSLFSGGVSLLSGGAGPGEIPIEFVNDGYCDCPDGSDEPGTGACSWIVRALRHTSGDQIPPFQCEKSIQGIQHSHVNDGVCDCCDGSDETTFLAYPGWEGAHTGWAGKPCAMTCSAEQSRLPVVHEGRNNKQYNSANLAKKGRKETVLSSDTVGGSTRRGGGTDGSMWILYLVMVAFPAAWWARKKFKGTKSHLNSKKTT